MPIADVEKWRKWVAANADDPYGKTCVDVARRVMEILDEEPGDFDAHTLIGRADHDVEAGGITGFMAECVATMVSTVHDRGEEFRRKWIATYGVNTDGVVNPAILDRH